ncbi:tRNA-dihydrouridine(16/17) synthase [NAD(P)(+)] [Lates japonicus]|uniref:tRNA-dihydrouridine(16/17) synthase [NAD(P)(+)] n=1 Tax=Lates japonicus TaxID=270547 RepID=A0AAD3MTP5_LATJO|nr:tRNA-dihydrouridine(16/17) synthase [NAD(P)(+)] [Lates japonicus]
MVDGEVLDGAMTGDTGNNFADDKRRCCAVRSMVLVPTAQLLGTRRRPNLRLAYCPRVWWSVAVLPQLGIQACGRQELLPLLLGHTRGDCNLKHIAGLEVQQYCVACEQCGNPKGNKCVFNLCRGCCKKKAYKEVADCPSHGLRFKTKAEKRKADEDNRKEGSATETEKSSSSPRPLPHLNTGLQGQSQAHLPL